ncbi:MAG: hypothetical protein RL011_711, partial [Pseudomonadota bacterium]
MIVIVTSKSELAEEVRQLLRPFGVPTKLLTPGDSLAIRSLYAADVVGAVVDASVPDIPDEGWHDLLTNLGRRLPVVVLGEHVSALVRTQLTTVTWLDRPKAEHVLSVL